MDVNSQNNEEVNTVSVSEENTVEETKVEEQKPVISEKKKGNKKIIIPIVVILILLVALFAIYKIVFCNSKNIFLRAVNSEYQKLDDKLDEVINSDINKAAKDKTVSSNVELDFDISVNEDLMVGTNYDEMIEEINKLSLEMDSVLDNKNKEFSYDIKAKYDEDDLINVLAYGQDENIYFELKDLFDKYIEIPVEEYDALFEGNKSVEDSRYILETVKDSFLNNLNEKDFIKTSAKTDLNGKSVSVKKITYSFNEKKALNLAKAVLVDLKGNSKFIEKCASITGEDKEDIKESIQDSIDEIKDEIEYVEDSDETIELSVYTHGLLNKVVKYEIRVIADDEKISFTYSDYKDITTFEVVQDDEKLLTSKTTKEGKDTYKTKVNMDTINVVINSKITDTKNTHKYTMTVDDSEMEISGELTSTNKEVKKNKEYNGSFKFSLGIDMEDEEVATIVIDGKSTNKIGEDLKMPKFDDSVSYTELTETDLNTIMNNLSTNKNLVKFITKISTYTSSSTTY